MEWLIGISAGKVTILLLFYFMEPTSSEKLPKSLQPDGQCNTRHNTTDAAQVMFVILGEDTGRHAGLARRLRAELLSQGAEKIHLVSEAGATGDGGWTAPGLLAAMLRPDRGGAAWLVLCPADARVRLPRLLTVLGDHDSCGLSWTGRALRDRRRAARHHYAPAPGLSYPHPGACFAVTAPLLDKLSGGAWAGRSSFSIDPQYELAEYILLNTNAILKHDGAFCYKYDPNCATFPERNDNCESVSKQSMYFAIKTFRENHSTKAQVVKSTWVRQAPHYHFFSDLNDTSLPAVDTRIQNTLRGHCEKTVTILKLIQSMLPADVYRKMQWIILTDDDTILSVRKMEEVLGCFSKEKRPVMIGERYGYGYGNNRKGYDFVTGGGGVALSSAAAALLSRCACAAADAPDDMWLGACARQNHISVLHHDSFHQGQPLDYPAEYLEWAPPASFHGATGAAARALYREWFREPGEGRACGHGARADNSRDEL